MTRYKTRPWTRKHSEGGNHHVTVETTGVMVSDNKHCLFIAGDNVYEVCNALIDAHEAMTNNNIED